MQERGNRWLKLIDRWIGIPLTFVLGQGISKKIGWETFTADDCPRIALIKTAAIGDTVLLSAIIREIRQTFPFATLTLICTRNNIAAANLLDGINHIHLFDLRSPLASFRLLRRLPRQDAVLDFGAWARINSLIAIGLRASYRVGFSRRAQFRHYVYNQAIPHRDDIHELGNYRALLLSISVQPVGFSPLIIVKKPFDTNVGNKNIVFHPFPGGSGKELKEWPAECWVELGKKMTTQGYVVFISGGKEDSDRADSMAEKISETGVAQSVAGCYSLEEMAGLLQTAQLVVSVNTGIMHLAAAIGTPVVALHGPTSTLRWRAIGENVVDISSNKSCSPCLSLGFEYGCEKGGCMQDISVAQVLEGIHLVTRKGKIKPMSHKILESAGLSDD